MRLVDGNECEPALREQLQAARCQQPLGRDVDEIELTAAHPRFDLRRLRAGQGRIQERRAHAELGQRRDLVLHQRN